MRTKIVMLIFWLVLLALHGRLAVLEIRDNKPLHYLMARCVFLVLCSAYIVKNVRAIRRGDAS